MRDEFSFTSLECKGTFPSALVAFNSMLRPTHPTNILGNSPRVNVIFSDGVCSDEVL